MVKYDRVLTLGAKLGDVRDEIVRRLGEPGLGRDRVLAAAVRTVAAHPEWLSLPGTTVAVLGAGAEMGPLTALLRWGATVAAVDLPRPVLWQRVLDTARRGLFAAVPRRTRLRATLWPASLITDVASGLPSRLRRVGGSIRLPRRSRPA